MVVAGDFNAVLLRSDGSVVVCGDNSWGQCNIPPLDKGMSYIQVSAGSHHTVLLLSDGSAVACGWNNFGQCDIPPLDEGMSYTQVSAGCDHTVLLRSDGSVVACGSKTMLDNATFHLWMTECHILKLLHVLLTQCFFVVMAVL